MTKNLIEFIKNLNPFSPLPSCRIYYLPSMFVHLCAFDVHKWHALMQWQGANCEGTGSCKCAAGFTAWLSGRNLFSNWIVISYPKPRKVVLPPIGYQSSISYKNDPCSVERCGQTTGDYIKSKTPPPYWVYLRWAAARHRIPYQMYWIRILADWWKLDVPYQRTRHSGEISNADFPKLICPCAWKPR